LKIEGFDADRVPVNTANAARIVSIMAGGFVRRADGQIVKER
jgi:hypothetical protein